MIKPRSLRARLALWHAALLALTLVSLSVFTYLLLRRTLPERADANLQDYADKTARTIAETLYQSSMPGRSERPRFLNKDLEEWGRQIQVSDAQTGEPIEWSDSLASHKLPLRLTARVRGQQGLTTFETFDDLGEFPVRVVTVPVQMGHSVPYIVQAAASVEGIEDALRRASLILIILTPSVFILALVGGWILVGSSLKPVDAMTRTALSIQPGRMDRRIEAPGTDDEIAHLALAFNEMIARLDQSFRRIQQFSADASHELKTPLTSIRGEAEVALMGEREPEEYRQSLRSIIDEVARMSAIVENLLLLARADADQIRLRRERVALEDIVISAYEQMEPLALQHRVALDLDTIEEAEVEGDPLWLGQILTNLLNNALKYTPEGGTVTLALRRAKEARVSVADTGHGIPAEHLPHIFDRFYRVDSGRSRDAGGVGLGLNISQWAAHALGGRIEVESEIGRGAIFTLCLPLLPEAPQTDS